MLFKDMFGISATRLSTSPTSPHSVSCLRHEVAVLGSWVPAKWGRKDPKGSRDHDASGMVSQVETKGCNEGTTPLVEPTCERVLSTKRSSSAGQVLSKGENHPNLSLLLDAMDQVQQGRALDRSNKNNINSLRSPSGTGNLELKVQPSRRSMGKVSGAIGFSTSVENPPERLDQVQQDIPSNLGTLKVESLLSETFSSKENLREK